MLLIGGIPITIPTVLCVTLAVGATQLTKYKIIVTPITAIEELAGVTPLLRQDGNAHGAHHQAYNRS